MLRKRTCRLSSRPNRFGKETLSIVFGLNLSDDVIIHILAQKTIDSFSSTKAVEPRIRGTAGDTYIEETCGFS
jgi:hypothetical protein